MAGSIVASTAAFSSSSDNAPTVNVPAGVGIVYVLTILTAEVNTVTWPSGFTELAESGNETSLNGRIRTAIRTYTGSEGATFASTTSSYSAWAARCALLTGVDAALVTSDSTGNYTGYGTTSALTGGSVTTGAAGRYIFWIGGALKISGTNLTSLTPPTSFTEHGSTYAPFVSTFISFCTYTEPLNQTTSYSGSAGYGDSDTRNGLTATLVFTETVTGQFLRPEADISAGTWVPSSGSDLYATIDETIASDTDYDSTSSDSAMEVALTSGVDPLSSSGHIVRYRIKGTANLTAGLYQGATLIASWAHAPAPSSYTTYEQTLSGGEADAISDYTNLRLRFTSS